VDVIIEGQINSQEESIEEVVTSVAALKTCQTPILRLTDETSELQGRILFSQGGFLLGGKVNVTGETGYEAIKQLLTIKKGNYAVLDPGRRSTADLNQGLWLNYDKILEQLSNLLQEADKIVDLPPERINDSAVRPKSGQIDLAPIMAAVAAPKDESPLDLSIPQKMEEEQRQTVAPEAPSRKYNDDNAKKIRFVLQLVTGVGVALIIMMSSDVLYGFAYSMMKMAGIDADFSKVFPSDQIAAQLKKKLDSNKTTAPTAQSSSPASNDTMPTKEK
jgi:hypothetical protein